MAKIHPTAIVDDRAVLADDVEIGPWCMIEGQVRIGAGTRLLHGVTVVGPAVIGSGNTLYPTSVIGTAPQDLKFDPSEDGVGTVIGDGNLIREGVTIHRATQNRPTTLGNDNYLMVNSHLGHDAQVGSNVMLANGALLAGHVEVGDGVILGGNAQVHQHVRLGRLSMVSGGAGMVQDVPPFCTGYIMRTISSLNLIGLRRGGLRDSVKPLEEAFRYFFKSRHTKPVALERIRSTPGLMDDPAVQEFVAFIETSKKGISDYNPKA